MKSVKILSVSKDGAIISVFKEITNDDNTVEINQHMFSEETLEWRAAEYDTTDQDALIDLIIYSPYMDQSEPGLYDYPNSAAAKNSHGANIISIKARLRPPGPDNSAQHYQTIKGHSHFDPEAIELKRGHVTKTFDMMNATPKPEQNDKTRIDKLRQQLADHSPNGNGKNLT